MHSKLRKMMVLAIHLALVIGTIVSIAPIAAATEPTHSTVSRFLDSANHGRINQEVANQDGVDQIGAPQADFFWVRWTADLHAFAEESCCLWIAGGGGVIRFDKSKNTWQRFTALEGLPHHTVLAVAIDPVGNRWFGGDGGLSRLNTNNVWTHYNASNSGLHENRVDEIAVAADGSIWAGHSASGKISRRLPDGTWQFFPNVTAAVSLDYARVKQTQNANQLWTVVGNDVWADYQAYNGSQWIDRTPAGQTEKETVAIAAQKSGVVWVLQKNGQVQTWNGSTWTSFVLASDSATTATALTVDAADKVWLGLWRRPNGLSDGHPLVGQVQQNTVFTNDPARRTPISALLPFSESVRAIGPGWLLQPDNGVVTFSDLPRYSTVDTIALDPSSTLWLHSSTTSPTTLGGWQRIDTNATPQLRDDQWFTDTETSAMITALDRAPNGELWAGYFGSNRNAFSGYSRYRQGGWGNLPSETSLAGPGTVLFRDLFVQNGQMMWSAFDESVASTGELQGVRQYDDRGTPADSADDVRTDYPLAGDGDGGAVTVDALGRLWYGNNKGLFRREGDAWLPVTSLIISINYISDLTPANDGSIFALRSAPNGGTPTRSIILVRSDGQIESGSVDVMVEKRLALALTATRRNKLWTIAPDGGLWYLVEPTSPALSQWIVRRRTSNGITDYPLPQPLQPISASSDPYSDLTVDSNGYVWLIVDKALFRLSFKPDFALAPQSFLLAPGLSRSRQILIESIEGFDEEVVLSVDDFAANITATLAQSTARAGTATSLTVNVGMGILPGLYTSTLVGTSGVVSRSVPISITVVETLYEGFLPVVAR